MGKHEKASLFIGIGLEILFGIIGATIKDMPTIIVVTGYTLGGLLILYGLLGFWYPNLLRIKRIDDDLEIRITPSKYGTSDKPNPYYGIIPGHNITALFGLVLVNHSEKEKRIESASLSLKKRVLIGSKKLFSVPVIYLAQPDDKILQDIVLKPHEKRDFSVLTSAHIPAIVPFPHKSRLMLGLKIIGYPQNIERELYLIKHDPKLVPDIPDWKKQ